MRKVMGVGFCAFLEPNNGTGGWAQKSSGKAEQLVTSSEKWYLCFMLRL